MNPPLVAACLILGLTAIAAIMGFRRALAVGEGSRRQLHSIPFYHGSYVALLALLPGAIVLLVGLALQQSAVDFLFERSLPQDLIEAHEGNTRQLVTDVKNIAAGRIFEEPSEAERAAADRFVSYRHISSLLIAGLTIAVALGGALLGWLRIQPDFWARNRVETIVNAILFVCATIAVLTTLGVVASVAAESIRFFARVPLSEFFTSLTWNPTSAIRVDQAVGEASFGVLPVFAGTLLITLVALSVGVPLGLLVAIYLSSFAPSRVRSIGKPVVEILSGIPTVVYGFFAALTVAPLIADMAASLGLEASHQSALAAGSVMGIMIIPFVSSLTEDVITSLPDKLRQAALTLGATHGETVRRVLLPAALPGIVGAVILAFSVAIGETMIVLMAAGLAANLTLNPLDPVTTMTVQIATILTGDQSFDSATTLSAYALTALLFVITLAANYFALHLVDKYKVQE